MKNTRRRFAAIVLAVVLAMGTVAPAAFAEYMEYTEYHADGYYDNAQEEQYYAKCEVTQYESPSNEYHYYCEAYYTAYEAAEPASDAPLYWTATSTALPVVADDFTFTNPRYVTDGSITIEAVAGLSGDLYYVIANNLAGLPGVGAPTGNAASPLVLGEAVGSNIANWQWLRVYQVSAGNVVAYRQVRIPYYAIGVLLFGPEDLGTLAPGAMLWFGDATGPGAFSNFRIDADLQIVHLPGGSELRIPFRSGYGGYFYGNSLNFMPWGPGQALFRERWNQIGPGPNFPDALRNAPTPITIIADGGNLRFYADSATPLLNVNDNSFDIGRIGFQMYGDAEAIVNNFRISNIRVASQPPDDNGNGYTPPDEPVVVGDFTLAAPRDVADGSIEIADVDGLTGTLYFVIANSVSELPTTGPIAAVAGAAPLALNTPVGTNISDWQWLRVYQVVAGDIVAYREVRLPYYAIGTLLFGPDDLGLITGSIAVANVDNFVMEADIRMPSSVADWPELQFRLRDIPWYHIRLAMNAAGHVWVTSGQVDWSNPITGPTPTHNLGSRLDGSDYVSIRLVADGTEISLYRGDGSLVFTAIDNIFTVGTLTVYADTGMEAYVNNIRVNRIRPTSQPPGTDPDGDIIFDENVADIDDGYIIIDSIDGMGATRLYYVLADSEMIGSPIGANISTITGNMPLTLGAPISLGSNPADITTRFVRVFETDENGIIIRLVQAWIPWNRIGTLMDTPDLAGPYDAGQRWFFGEEDWGDYRLQVELGWNGTAYGAGWPGFLVHFRIQEDRIGGPGHPGDYLYITQGNIALQRYYGGWITHIPGEIDMTTAPLHLVLEVHGNMVRVWDGTRSLITSATVFNSGATRPHGRMGLFLDGVYAEVNNLRLNRIRPNDDPPEPPPPRDLMNQQAVENVGVWPIARPVAGQFPTGLYLYRFRPGTSQMNITGAGGANNFHQTITWYPEVPDTFEPNTQYTATLRLGSQNNNRTFAYFPLSVAETLSGLPTDGVQSITARHDGHDLVIDIAFVSTGAREAASRVMHEDFSLENADARNVHGLGNYFRHGPQDNNRHGLSTWRDNAGPGGSGAPLSFVRESADEGIGNEMVIGFVRESTHAPGNVSQAFRDNWITAGVATTRDRNNNNLGTNRGNTSAFETTYGFIESSIQFDVMRGAWGAFWTFAYMVDFFDQHPDQQGATGTEIDVVETFHAWRGPTDSPAGPNTFNNALHFNGYGMHHSGGSQNHNSTTLADIFGGEHVNVYDGNFHNFAVEWTPSYYIFFLNGREIARFGEGHFGNRIMQNPSYLKFSIEASDWAGGLWGGGAHVPFVEDESGEFRVDFVSVWNGPRPNIVTYMANGGTGSMDESLVVRGNAYTVAANAFTRNGYNFTGWNTCPNGTGTAHAAGSAITTSTNIVDITLYAQWEAATLPVFSLHAFNNGVINNQSLANGGTIRIWTRLDGANALVPFAGLNVTAAFSNGESAMHLVNINRLWNNQNYVNFVDVNMHAPWQRIYLTATLHGQVVELTLVNPRFFSLQAFNNGTINNQSLANNGVIRIWTQLMGTNALVPNSLVVTAVDQDNNNAMHLVRINEPWANPGFVNLVDVNFDAPWQRIYFTATVFGQTVELVLINPRPPVVPEFSLNVFNNGVINNQSLANAGLIRLWTRLDGVNANVLITEITAVDQDGNDAMVHLRRINTVGVSPQNGFDVNFNAPWQRIYLTVTAYGQTLELTLVNPS